MKARLYEGKADHSPYDHWLQLHSHGSCTVYRSHDLLAACTVISPEFFLFSPLRAASSQPAIAIVHCYKVRVKVEIFRKLKLFEDASQNIVYMAEDLDTAEDSGGVPRHDVRQ